MHCMGTSALNSMQVFDIIKQESFTGEAIDIIY